MPWRREGSQLREISPKASLDLLAASWHGAPGVLEKFSSTLLITPIMRAQCIFSRGGDTRSNPTVTGALGLRCLCLVSSIVVAQPELNFTQRKLLCLQISVYLFI